MAKAGGFGEIGYTEGLETPDLKEAKGLLDGLA
jgi:hypothetical protein